MQRLAGGAITIALVGYLESITIARAFARKHKYEIDPNQEFIALGTGNIFGSFFKSYPVTGSFSRTAVNAACSVKTLVAAPIAGIVVIIALEVVTSTIKDIPKSCLAAVIICAALTNIDLQVNQSCVDRINSSLL